MTLEESLVGLTQLDAVVDSVCAGRRQVIDEGRGQVRLFLFYVRVDFVSDVDVVLVLQVDVGVHLAGGRLLVRGLVSLAVHRDVAEEI